MSEKTEQPTAKRIRDARSKGQVAKSQEIHATVQLSIVLLWLGSQGAALQQALSSCIQATLAALNLPLQQALALLSGQLLALMLHFMLGLSAALVLAITLAGMLQTGFLFAPAALQPSSQRLNPLANLKHMVSLRSLFELTKMLLKVGVLGLSFFYMIGHYAASFAHLPQAQLAAGLALCAQLAQWMCLVLLAATAVFAIADYAVQHHQLRKQLMMSRDDIKQEYKQNEGNPEIKQRRRELHREVHSGSLASKVAQSSVVVRNPTHIAVCLRYDATDTPVPLVLAYGRDARALHIVALAEAQGIPIVENITLARALVAQTQPGDYVPQSLFAAVAQVLSLLQRHWGSDEKNAEENVETSVETSVEASAQERPHAQA